MHIFWKLQYYCFCKHLQVCGNYVEQLECTWRVETGNAIRCNWLHPRTGSAAVVMSGDREHARGRERIEWDVRVEQAQEPVGQWNEAEALTRLCPSSTLRRPLPALFFGSNRLSRSSHWFDRRLSTLACCSLFILVHALFTSIGIIHCSSPKRRRTSIID